MNQKKVLGTYKFTQSKHDVCRTCLSEDSNLTSVFLTDSSLNATYCDIISSITGLEIRKELGLPTSICPPCKRNAVFAYRYKLQAIRSDETLRGVPNYDIKPEKEFKSLNCVDGEKDIKMCLKTEKKQNSTSDDELKNEKEFESVLKGKKNKHIGNSDRNQTYPAFVKMEFSRDYDDDHSCDDLDRDEMLPLSLLNSNRSYDAYIEEEKAILYEPVPRGAGMPQRCEVSSASFEDKSMLQQHSLNYIKAEDVKEKRNYCPMCGESFDTAVELVRHARSHDRLVTDAGINAESMNSRDMSQSSDYNWTPVKKKRIKKTIRRSNTVAQKGQPEKIKLENTTPEQTEVGGACGVEMQEEQGVPEYPHCGICSLKFRTQKKLDNHFRAHSNTTVIMCPLCDKFFLEHMYFKRHLLNGHSSKDDYLVLSAREVKTTKLSDLMTAQAETFPDLSLYLALCQQCGQLTLSAKDFMDHSKEHPKFNYKISQFDKLNYDNNSGYSGPCEPNKPHKCKLCEKKFRLPQHLMCHIKNKHNVLKRDQHECYICGKKFDKFDRLEKHKYRSHRAPQPDGKKFHCDMCDYKSFEKYNLAAHLRVHSPVKLKPMCVVCQYCGKTVVKKDMPAHIRRVHTGERPYKCTYCDKAFVRGGDRVAHERIHTGYKPYSCDVCGLRSTKSLAVHKRIHTGERPHKCSHCDQRFTQKGDMRAHERRHTGESAFVCKECGKTFTHAKYLREHKTVCPDE